MSTPLQVLLPTLIPGLGWAKECDLLTRVKSCLHGKFHTPVQPHLCEIEYRERYVQHKAAAIVVFCFFTRIEVYRLSAVALSKSLHALQTGHVTCECMVSEGGDGIVQSLFPAFGVLAEEELLLHTSSTLERISAL